MTEYHWHETYTRAVEAFDGETPGPQVEQAILSVFRDHPAMVTKALDRIAAAKAAGKVTSGWAVWRAEVLKQAQPRSETASDTGEREKRVRQAEQRIRATGHEIPTRDELLDDVFGDRGLLRAWSADEALRERMLALWGQVCPEPVAVAEWAE